MDPCAHKLNNKISLILSLRSQPCEWGGPQYPYVTATSVCLGRSFQFTCPLFFQPIETPFTDRGGLRPTRRLARQPGTQSIREGVLDSADVRPLVNPATVPDDDDVAAQVLEQEPEKLRHLRSFEVVLPKLNVKPHPRPPGGHGDRRDGGDTVVPVAVADDGSLTLWTPGSAVGQNEHEAAFIKKRDVGAKSSGFFLLPATCAASSARWLPRRAESRVSLAPELTAPAAGLEQFPDVTRVVMNAEPLSDHGCNPLQGPQLVGIAVGHGSLEQELQQSVPLPRRQFLRTA